MFVACAPVRLSLHTWHIPERTDRFIRPGDKVCVMAELIIRPEGGRPVTIQISEADARRILNDLVFQPGSPSVDKQIGLPARPAEGKIDETTEVASGSDFLPIPSRDEIAAFIKSQPDYEHSVQSIARHFANTNVSSSDGKAAELWLNSIRSAGNRIRGEIETDEGGKWVSEVVSDRYARQKVFRFMKQTQNKDNQDSIKFTD